MPKYSGVTFAVQPVEENGMTDANKVDSYRRNKALDMVQTYANSGGLTMGMAPALLEEITYDEHGNIRGGTLMDYLLPTSMETPAWEVAKTVTPSPHHPIGAKGARLTQEVSLAGRFVVIIPNQPGTYGISKRLSDDERKRLRRILDDVRPENHGLIVRTAAEGASESAPLGGMIR